MLDFACRGVLVRVGPRVRACRVACWSRVGRVLAACWLRVGRVVIVAGPGRLFFEAATCPGQLRCLGQNFFSEIHFFEEATCPGLLRCRGQNFFSEIRLFF